MLTTPMRQKRQHLLHDVHGSEVMQSLILIFLLETRLILSRRYNFQSI